MLNGRPVDREAAAVVVQRERAPADRLDPARGPSEAAERIEVQPLDGALRILGALPGEPRDQSIGVAQAGELEQVARLARQHAHRVAHPHSRVIQEAPECGRARYADVNRQIAALGADHVLPSEQRLGLEHELSDQARAGGGPRA